VHADKGYDYLRCRRYLHRRGIKVRIAHRGIEDKTKLGRHRWVVERTVSWLLRFNVSDCATTAHNSRRARCSPWPAY
jgi:IS5 family transposase